MSAIPTITQFQLSNVSKIILACDGIFEGDFIKNNALGRFISHARQMHNNPAQYLCFDAARLGSTDNMSCIVIDVDGLQTVLDGTA